MDLSFRGATESRFNRFFICLLDVLGFESQFAELGLGGVLEKYIELVSVVDDQNAQMQALFGNAGFRESAYWAVGREVLVFSRLYGAWASDSILLFAHADFPANRYPEALESTPEHRRTLASDPSLGWMYHTVPCDSFLDLCNEVMCRSVEVRLPLRGAIALGDAVIRPDASVFLGAPLIEAARLEHAQRCIGASFANSFMGQVVPSRYQLSYTQHVKPYHTSAFSGSTLDWPRHWRKTRSEPLDDALRALDRDPNYRVYYEHTLAMAEASASLAELSTEPDNTAITAVYPQFSNIAQLKLPVFAVRRLQPSDDDEPA